MRLSTLFGHLALLGLARAAPVVVERQLRGILEVSLASSGPVYLPTSVVDCAYDIALSGSISGWDFQLAVVTPESHRLPWDQQKELSNLGIVQAKGTYSWSPEMDVGQHFRLRVRHEGRQQVRFSEEHWVEEGFVGAEGCWERHPKPNSPPVEEEDAPAETSPEPEDADLPADPVAVEMDLGAVWAGVFGIFLLVIASACIASKKAPTGKEELKTHDKEEAAAPAGEEDEQPLLLKYEVTGEKEEL
ncbi:hypothetical protein JCM10213_008524 [Rhodosporidiobolus nylandii]